MAKVLQIQHATVVVDDLEKACAFYEHELGLEALPTFNLDFPAQFFKINEEQQLHVTEWEDQASFRGHLCLQVDAEGGLYKSKRDDPRGLHTDDATLYHGR